MIIEQRPVNVNMITTRGQQGDQPLIQSLKVIFERHGVSGSVLLLPRKSNIDRYVAVGNVEILIAAIAVGIETVSGLIGLWPNDIRSTIPMGLPALLDVSPMVRQSDFANSATTQYEYDAMAPLDRARYYRAQVEKFGSQKKAAHQLRIPRSRINNAVQLLKLHASVQKAVEEQLIPESAARTISLAPTEAQQLELFRWYCESLPRPTIRELEASIRTLAAREGDPTANGKLVQRFCAEFTEQHGVTLRYTSTGVGGWCSLDIADPSHGAQVFSNLSQLASCAHHRLSARQHGVGLRIRFHVTSNVELEQLLLATQLNPDK